MRAQPGLRYRHFKGGEYTVKIIALDAGDPTREMVVYEGVDGQVWVRHRDEFEGLHESGVPRFSLIY